MPHAVVFGAFAVTLHAHMAALPFLMPLQERCATCTPMTLSTVSQWGGAASCGMRHTKLHRQPGGRPAHHYMPMPACALHTLHIPVAHSVSAHIHHRAGDLTPSNVLLTSAAKDPRRFICKVWFVRRGSTLCVDALQAFFSRRRPTAPAPSTPVRGLTRVYGFWIIGPSLFGFCRPCVGSAGGRLWPGLLDGRHA